MIRIFPEKVTRTIPRLVHSKNTSTSAMEKENVFFIGNLIFENDRGYKKILRIRIDENRFTEVLPKPPKSSRSRGQSGLSINHFRKNVTFVNIS